MSTPSFAARIPAVLALFLVSNLALAQHDTMHVHATKPGAAAGRAPVFVASSAKPFPALMADAMAVMEDGMARAPMNGNPEHDFVAMMLPHHQGAIDMARAVLLHTKDPALRNLALGIIAEQQNEINLMQARLQHHSSEGKHQQ